MDKHLALSVTIMLRNGKVCFTSRFASLFGICLHDSAEIVRLQVYVVCTHTRKGPRRNRVLNTTINLTSRQCPVLVLFCSNVRWSESELNGHHPRECRSEAFARRSVIAALYALYVFPSYSYFGRGAHILQSNIFCFHD